MAPTIVTTFSVESLLPTDIEASLAVQLVQDHDAYISLDDHILKHTQLFHCTLEAHGELGEINGVSDWLSSKVRRIAAESSNWDSKGGRPRSPCDIEFWELEMAHPLGRIFSNLKYTAGFINIDGPEEYTWIVVDVPGMVLMRSWTKYAIKKAQLGSENTLFLVEQANIECTWGFANFIKSKIETTHKLTHQKVIHRLKSLKNSA